MKIIGVGGGSGSGKTSLARSLVEKYTDKFDMISLDKYKKVSEDISNLPRVKGLIDWDHPTTNNWGKLLKDIKTLQSGSTVTIDIWTLGDNPQDPKYKVVKTRTISPRDILIIEGYLALWHKDLRNLYARSYFLEIEQDVRLKRRDRVVDKIYDKEIHIPSHNEYVEPTRKFADVVLDISKLSFQKVIETVIQDLKNSELL